ncbi:LysR family transcriptional regulator [Bosea sp. NBC_00550]|uniref:LysR family transcriptional regulator n=1 Tax=Bosea sp. NBC_00550 TaxID=2969621 RepID=UPI00222EA0B6|nr:LysR family transcriptional regulator [Bosea sp. NBC_00550]UZF90311.1 LysR family transcriptional regulator [Bosea sp. NBC_00550]
MDRLTSMEVFVRAVDLGSFAAAAETLDLSAPMVGKHVRFLEERLGARLLNRTTRRQSLTDVGRAYYDRCRTILAETTAAEALAGDHLGEPSGRLRVTMPAHFGRRCVAPVLFGLAQRYPRLELELSFGDPIADLVQQGYDLAIRTGTLEDRSGIVARRIARQPMLLCAAPAYLERHGTPTGLDDLAQHQAILYGRAGWVRPWQFPQAGLPPLEIAPSGRLRFDDLDAMADAAVAGLGLSWLPAWLIRDRLRSGELAVVLPDQPPFLYDGYALWPQSPLLPLKVRVAVDELAKALPPLMA